MPAEGERAESNKAPGPPLIRVIVGIVGVEQKFGAPVMNGQHVLQFWTPDTHFIASTGIDGACADIDAKVAMDACAVSGLQPDQVEYLEALEHLSPTRVYGVLAARYGSVIACR